MDTSKRAKPLILAVDDEQHITELISLALGMKGYDVKRVATGRAALEAVETDHPDLIVLDVMLPDLDGFVVARRLRETERAGSRVPIIFLTAKDTLEDKLEGLSLGVDDYMTKPFSVEELILRVQAILRRSGAAATDSQRITFHDLELDSDTREVRRAGRLIELTPTEFKLLRYLMANARNVLTREQLLEHVWEYTFKANASVLETYISYLRQKVDATNPPLIHTVRGIGYSLRLPAE